MKTSGIDRLYTRLKSGRSVTKNEAKTRFGLKNLSSAVAKLRQAGFEIDTTTIRDRKNGGKVTAYRMNNILY